MIDQEAILQEAEKLLSQMKFTDAINLLSPNISENHFLLLKRAQAYLGLLKTSEGLEDIEKFLNENQKHEEGVIVKTKLLLENDDLENAINFLSNNISTTNNIHNNLLIRIKKEKDDRNILPLNSSERIMYDTFTKWLKEKGAKYSKIEIRYYAPSYRGVHATKTIPKGEIFLYVPFEYMITLSKAKNSQIGQKMKIAASQLIYPTNSTLSAFLLEEKSNPETKWATYFQILPSDVSSFPNFYNEAERKLLRNTIFNEEINELIEDIQKDYETICNAEAKFKQHSFMDFMKARAIVNSRIFGVKINNHDDDSIVPMADMFNYSHESSQTAWAYNPKTKGFEVKAKCEISRGEPIYEGYGLKHNANYLMFYGFVIENNSLKKLRFPVPLEKNDKLLAYKKEIICKGQNRKILITPSTSGSKFDRLMGCLRVAVLKEYSPTIKNIKSKIDAETPSTKKTVLRKQIPILTKENEFDALKALLKFCTERLQKFDSSYEDDMKLLNDPNKNMGYNERNCYVIRSDEKYVLNYFVDFINLVLPSFDMALKETQEMLQSLIDTDRHRDYAEKLLEFFK